VRPCGARRAALALALIASTAAPDGVRAGDVVLDFTESFFADWHWTLDDPQLSEDRKLDVIDFRNRFNARVRWDELTFGLRLDAAFFPSPPSAQYASDFRPEELFVTWRRDAWTLTVGDDYLTVGRGMALSLRKFDEVGVTTSLRGVHALHRSEAFRMRLGAGFSNVVNVDLVEEKKVPDPNDLVALARVDVPLVDGLELGLHGVHIERRHSDIRSGVTGALFGDGDTTRIQGRRFIRSTILGASLDWKGLADVLDLYAEADWLLNDETRASLEGDVPSGKDGLAIYVAGTAALGDWTVLLEGKHYDHFRVASTLHPDTAEAQGITQTFLYHAPPTLERIDQRVINNTDVSGVHLRIDKAFPPADTKDTRNSVFASAAWFMDAPAPGEWTLHAYAGWERNSPSGERLLLQSGVRLEEAPTEGITRLRMVHLDLDWSRVVTPGVDFQLHWNHELRETNLGAPSLQDSFNEGTFYASLNFVPTWSFTAQVEYLTSRVTEDPVFPGAFLQYRWSLDSFVRLFVGRAKGGLKCSGGICRIFPNFEGVKLETTFRF
jgi:hypothetical protein